MLDKCFNNVFLLREMMSSVRADIAKVTKEGGFLRRVNYVV